jgi:murein DD-endopeptidase MepM/ murein hydrolase activator NlpD
VNLHIILVSDRLATARTFIVTGRHMVTAAVLLMALVVALATLLSYVSLRHAAELRMPVLQDLLRTVNAEENQRSRAFVRENLNAMAIKLGEMQAQMTRLDFLGERLAGLAGVKLQEFRQPEAANSTAVADGKPGRGGPLVNPSPMSEVDLQQALDSLSRQVETRSDTLSLLESQLFDARIRKLMLPTTLPVPVQWNASSFGWRIDPFTGERAMHEGVDFPSEIGTPIVAAAAGIVVAAERHPQYGNFVDIDHGQDLVTRYGHASKLLVKVGELVKRGQPIALVGSTGRSTGPHLHFEVRYKGSAVNPNKFLQAAKESNHIAFHQ